MTRSPAGRGRGGDTAEFSRLPLRRVEGRPGDSLASDVWPATVPAVSQVLRDGLDFGSATVLVGENGTGKSTLVEGIAMAFGLNAEGGTRNTIFSTPDDVSNLHEHLRCVRGAGAARWGFFLRAETMHSYFTNQPPGPADPHFHGMSHGESFRALLSTHRFDGPGLYVFDEPESALSFDGQLTLLAQLMDHTASDTAQVVLSTHSPVLASLPGATLYELGDFGLERRAWEDLDMVQHYRSYLDSPERYLRHLR